MLGETAVLRRYHAHLRMRALAPGSIKGYRQALAGFQWWLGDKPITEATRDDVVGWLASRGGPRGLTPRGRYTYISVLAGFYRWAIREELADRDPTLLIDRPRLPRRLPRPMAVADFHLAMKAATPRMRAWLGLAGYAGLRCKEIGGVQVDDLRLGFDPPILIVSHSKGDRERTVPLSHRAEGVLVEAGIPRSGFVFVRRDLPRSGLPVGAQSVSESINAHLHGLGINATAHQARHLFATVVYQKTKDLRLVQELLGHASPDTTAGYAAFSPSEAAAAIRDLELVDARVTGEAQRVLAELAWS